MLSFSSIRQFLRLLGQQNTGALVFELIFHPRTDLFKCRRGRRLHGEQFEDRVSMRKWSKIWRAFFARTENYIHKFRRGTHARETVGTAEKIGCDYLQAFGCGGFV